MVGRFRGACRMARALGLGLIVIVLAAASREAIASDRATEPPLSLHPDNPRYFLFRGHATFLITSGEHYGAVLNGDFDAGPYLRELQSRGFNLTRTFSGTYREVPGSFKIRENTLAPRPEKYIGPWARTSTPGAADGLTKFDLDAWNPAYFARLERFVVEAGRRGIVVEFVLFCPFYDEGLWAVNPMNPRNNVNDVGDFPSTEVYTLKHPALVARHEAFVKKVVTSLHPHDNVIFEICNEPYFGGVSLDWQARIADTIAATEAQLGGPKHLIAQNIANGRAKIESPHPAVSLFNFHYATPPDVLSLNTGLKAAIGDDETGFRGVDDTPYRTEAWEFLLAGGSLYSNLDYSFTTTRPDGTAKVVAPTPGGGGPALRQQLSILRRFLGALPFLTMTPDPSVVVGGVPEKARVQVLAEPGEAYAIYLNGGRRARLTLALPKGDYHADWVDTRNGGIAKTTEFKHAGGTIALDSPPYDGDMALRILAR